MQLGFLGGARFELLRVLGAGAMGVVYEANDRARNVRVALKRLKAVTPDALLRFKNEFRALQDLHHPNLVSFDELVLDGDQWFFTMELVDGVNFLGWVRPGESSAVLDATPHDDAATVTTDVPSTKTTTLDLRALPAYQGDVATSPRVPMERALPAFDEPRLRDALRQLARALYALHAAGKVHLDIKPSNILVTPGGRVVLLDFGLVTEVGRELWKGQVAGTPAYMAPEQAADLAVGPAADWYGVGVLLYQALTGRLPFSGSWQEMMMRKQREQPVRPERLVRELPADLIELCVDLLETTAAARPSGDDILQRLGAADVATDVAAVGPTDFVGRDGELAALETAFADARTSAVTVVVRGESGIGKSALVRELVRRLATKVPGALVLTGRCLERESVPFKAFDRVVDQLTLKLRAFERPALATLLGADAALLATAFPVLARVPALAEAEQTVSISDAQERRRRLFQALRRLLVAVADEQPLVLVIDDLQWADRDSDRLLQEILRAPDAPRLLLLATWRDEPGEDAAPLPVEGDVRELRLGALAGDDGARLARALLRRRSGTMEAVDARAIADEAGGHPLFIDELARHAGSTTSGQAPLKFEDAVRVRLDELPAGALALLRVVAIAGGPLAEAICGQAAAIAPESFVATLEALRAAHLLRAGASADGPTVETYHDRIRRVVLGPLSPAERAALHERLALALETQPASEPEMLAQHWAAAGQHVRAARYAVRGAERAAAALAFDRAAQLYRAALGWATHEPGERRRLLLALGDVLANAGRGADAATVYLEAVEGATAADALDARRLAAEQLLRAGRVDRGLAALREVLGAVDMALPATARRALMSLLAQRARIRLRGLDFEPRDANELPARTLTTIDICWSAAVCLAMVDNIRGADFQARHLLLALAAGEPYRAARALALEACYSATGGTRRQERTDDILARVDTHAERSAHPHARGWARAARGFARFLEGRFVEAATALVEGERIFRTECSGVAWEAANAALFSTQALFFTGRLRELAQRVPARLGEALDRGDLFAATNLRTAYNNIAWLAADDVATARRQAAEALASWSRGGFHVQHYYHLYAQAQIELYLGEAVAAHERIESSWAALARSQLLRVQLIRINMLNLRGRCAVAAAAAMRGSPRGDLARRALARAARCADALADEHAPWATPQAELLRVGIAAVRGERDFARAAAAAARAGFVGAGMSLHAQAIAWAGAMAAGGGAAAEAALAWAESEGVRRPARLLALIAPCGVPTA